MGVVNVVNKKLIKPCIPTPRNLQVYKLSFTDELSLPAYIPIILFYSPSPVSTDYNFIEKLETSLSKILPQFYPFAGRYVHEDFYVDCNDEGAEFVEARAASDVELLEFITNVNTEQQNALLPRETGALHDQATDPMLSVQVTMFKCGGLAIGVNVSHRIVDADSIKTFVAAWADVTNSNTTIITPSFDSPNLFPFKSLVIGLADQKEEPEPRTGRDPNVVAKRLVFDKEATASLKGRLLTQGVRASRVRVVCAIIAKALIGADRAKHGGRSRACLITQAVNMRERTSPPLSKFSCGNLVMQAATHITTSKDNIDILMSFEDLVCLLGDAANKTIAQCAEILGRGEAGHNVFLAPIMELIQKMETSFHDTNAMWFTDWSKFGFYRVADFGWGKPVWTSVGAMGERVIVLMDTKEGDGIEAWVHLNKDDLPYFEKDEDIKLLFACK